MQKILCALLLVAGFAQAMDNGISRFIPDGMSASAYARIKYEEEKRAIENDQEAEKKERLEKLDQRFKTELAATSYIDLITQALNQADSAGGSEADYNRALQAVAPGTTVKFFGEDKADKK